MATETNTFEQLAQEKANNPAEAAITKKSTNVQSELNLDDFSNTAIGDKVKYNRPDLNNKEDIVDKLQVFMPDINEEPKTSKSGDSKYWPITVLISYDSVNEDGIQNREYVSGAKAFQQRDGSSSDIQFYYDRSKTQCAHLWKLVAQAKKIEPENLSPREFIAFLNNKPKVKIVKKEYDNFGAPKGAPEFVYKNMIGEFL